MMIKKVGWIKLNQFSLIMRAGMTAVFFNGALWDLPWLQKIFPGTEAHPHKPDVVVNDFSEFWALVLACERHRK